MTMMTIPKELTKGEELVIIPRKLYEQFLRILKAPASSYSRVKLDKGLREALEDVKRGRLIGPFSSLKEGLSTLKHAS